MLGLFDILQGGLAQGFIWAILAVGVFVTFRLLDFADLSCEGCITLGAAVSSTLIWKGCNSFVSIIVAFLAGCFAGAVTGILHTKLKIPPILAGILTMISCYSINIHIMSLATRVSGTSNLSLLNYRNSTMYAKLASLLGISKNNSSLIIGFVSIIILIFVMYWFFGTELGSAIRATGTNANMCRAQGISTDLTKIIGLALSNGFIALSGALLAQYQGYADVSMGIGSIVIGLASIIIGEAIFAKVKNFALRVLGIIVGAVIYRVVVALVIFAGIPSTDLKLMTAVVVAIALAFTNIGGKITDAFIKVFGKESKHE